MNDIVKLLAYMKLQGIGPSALESLACLPEFKASTPSELCMSKKTPDKLASKLTKALEVSDHWEACIRASEAEIHNANKHGVRILCKFDDEFPQLLKETRDCPFFLYVRGRWHVDPAKSVAVIGTRQPTEHGKITASRVTQYLIEDGWSIVSGLALGCDTFAHQTAIDKGGHTVAVLAHGLHTIAPKQNEYLAQQIVDKGGILVSEYGMGVEALPFQFAKRDRIQAGLSCGVVMIQSDCEGGSMHASRASIEYNRLLIVPYPTPRDIEAKEKKIEANMILSGNDNAKKLNLINSGIKDKDEQKSNKKTVKSICSEPDLERIFVIRKREDYPELSQTLARYKPACKSGLEFDQSSALLFDL